MSRELVIQMLNESSQWENDTHKVRHLEEAVKQADAIPDEPLGYEARMELISAATFSGNYDVAFVGYGWCRNYARKNPDSVDWGSMIWYLKWVVTFGLHLPTISVAKIDEMLDDLEANLADNGYSARPAHGSRTTMYRNMGWIEKAQEASKVWLSTVRDELSDCRACEVHSEALLHVSLGENEKALEVAAPIIAETLTCSTKPQATYGQMIIPLLRLGDIERATEFLKIGFPMVQGNKMYIEENSFFMLAQTRLKDWEGATRNFDMEARQAEESNSMSDKYSFYVGAMAMMEGLLNDGIANVSLRVPAPWSAGSEDGSYDVAELRDWFDKQSDQIAAKFDARNGTTLFADEKAEWLSLAQ